MNSILYVKRLDTAVYTEVSEDVTLPDYLPEVRRVVGTQASVSTDGKYLTGEELEADGGVTCTVLYTAPDGSLAQFSETMSYTGHIPLKTGDDRYGSEDIVLSASADSVTCRVTAPRKLTLSVKVKLTALSQKGTDASLHCSADTGKDTWILRRKVKNIPAAYMTEMRQNGEVSGEIREREGMKLICASGSICLNDVRTDHASRNVQIKGDAYITALFCSPDGTYTISGSRAPVEESVSIPEKGGDKGEILPAAFGKVVLIEMEGSGDGTFAWRMEYDIDCVLIRSSAAQITTDAYLAGTKDTSSSETFRCVSPAAAVNGRLTTSASVHLRPGCEFVCAWGTASADQAEIVGEGSAGKMALSGVVKLSAVTCGGGEFFLDEAVIPLRYTCDAVSDAPAGGDCSGRIQLDVIGVTARPDGEMLNLTAELSIAAAILAEDSCTAMVSLAPEENGKLPVQENRIRIYVPDADETDWDVEKRFRLGTDAVREGHAYVIG